MTYSLFERPFAARPIDAEHTINGLPAEQRLAIRQAHVEPLVMELESWMRAARASMSRRAEVGKAMDYMLKRWDTFVRFLGDGRICLTNNAAGAVAAQCGAGQKGLAVRRIGPWRRARRSHVFAHRHGQAERRRPSRLVG